MRAFRVLTTAAVIAAAAFPALSQDIDPAIRPGDDFYGYANARWLKAEPLPPGVSSYGTTAMLVARNAVRVRDLVTEAAATPHAGLKQKVGDYYASLNDTAAIEVKGLAPLARDLAAIAAIKDRKGLAASLGRYVYLDDGTNSHTEGLIGMWIHQGFHDPEHYVPHVMQAGLGLYDRDAYLEPARAAERDAYRTQMAVVFKQAGFGDAEGRADRVLALETAIAKAQVSAAETADVFKTDNVWTRGDFDAKAPGMDWAAFLGAARLEKQKTFVVWQPAGITGISALVAGQPLDTWRDYLAFHLIRHYAVALPQAFGGQQADRRAQAVAATTDGIGEAIGHLYSDRYFPAKSKAAAEVMVADIREAFRAHIANAQWMSQETRTRALAKLEALQIGIGHAETWIDYTPLTVVRGDALGNVRRAEAFAYNRSLAKLSQRVDPAEWALLPQMVGGILNFSPNAMQFSAGLEQSPYFDPAGDAAWNYGSAGAGLSHEVSHSFDELGNIYDAHGNIGQWWTPDDLARYQAMAAPLTSQLNTYCPQADLCVKGKQVTGESLADLVGLQVAHDAYMLSLHGKPDVVKNGLTGEQRFFIAFAERWRKRQTDAALRQQVAADTHLPPEYRADAVRNLDAWYAAFDIKPGDKLYLKPEDRVRIW